MDDFLCPQEGLLLGGEHGVWKQFLRVTWEAAGELAEHNLIKSKLTENSLSAASLGVRQGNSEAPLEG